MHIYNQQLGLSVLEKDLGIYDCLVNGLGKLFGSSFHQLVWRRTYLGSQ